MINYNNLSFIHYLNLVFESTQQECRKFQSPFSAHNCFIPEAMPATEKKGPEMLFSMTSKPEITTHFRQAMVSGLFFL